jgi:hypothetical protein
MALRRSSALVLMLALSVLSWGCTKGKDEGGSTQKSGPQMHLNEKTAKTVGLTEILKKQKLANYPTATIGEAFDAYTYFPRKEWKEAKPDNGKTYVDFIGWFNPGVLNEKEVKDGIVGRGIQVKFVINPDGSYSAAMVSRLDARPDSRVDVFPIVDSAGVLAKIYENKEIRF